MVHAVEVTLAHPVNDSVISTALLPVHPGTVNVSVPALEPRKPERLYTIKPIVVTIVLPVKSASWVFKIVPVEPITPSAVGSTNIIQPFAQPVLPPQLEKLESAAAHIVTGVFRFIASARVKERAVIKSLLSAEARIVCIAPR